MVNMVTSDYYGCMVMFVKGKMENSGERAEIVRQCVYFLTCLISHVALCKDTCFNFLVDAVNYYS